MTPIRPTIGAPMHPWTRIAIPVIAVAAMGIGAIAGARATDGHRSATDRILSGAAGAAAIGGALVLGEFLSQRGAGMIDDAMRFSRTTGQPLSQFAWPAGTQLLTRGGAGWYVTPATAIGDALVAGGLIGIVGGGAATAVVAGRRS